MEMEALQGSSAEALSLSKVNWPGIVGSGAAMFTCRVQRPPCVHPFAQLIGSHRAQSKLKIAREIHLELSRANLGEVERSGKSA